VTNTVKVAIRSPCPAQKNMDLDKALLEEKSGSYLEFHQWEKPSFTHGFFVKQEEEFILSDAIDVGRRSTGGGILYHGNDLSFALCFSDTHPLSDPNTDRLYQKLNQLIGRAILEEHPCLIEGSEVGDFSFKEPFCMARPTKYDLVVGGKKVLGCAIRRKNGRILYHCSIPLRRVASEDLVPFLRRGSLIVEKILENTYAIGANWNQLRERIQDHVTKSG